jgi:sterol desaturase/sphingolipid hydroxylase (fatty acid hydroxylase superfamily)
MGWETLSPFIIVGSALLFIVLERIIPYDPGQKVLREGFWTDLVWYTIIQSYVLKVVIVDTVIPAIDGWTGMSRLQLVTHWPLWVQVAFFFVTHDFYIYWFHRWQHRSPRLWRIHEAHHSVKDVDWLAGSRSHSLEILINQTIEFLPVFLLGAAPEVFYIKGVIDAVWGMFIHSNLDVRLGVFRYLFNGPEMHRWHHAVEITEGGINFGTKLSLWDWIFGTTRLPARKPSGYGLGDVFFPRNYFLQHTFAFRPFHPERASAGNDLSR